jgi:hypothetical protein
VLLLVLLGGGSGVVEQEGLLKREIKLGIGCWGNRHGVGKRRKRRKRGGIGWDSIFLSSLWIAVE